MNVRILFWVIMFFSLTFVSEAEKSYNFVVEGVRMYSNDGVSGIEIDYGFGIKEGAPVILKGILNSNGLFDSILLVSDPDLIVILDSKRIEIERSTDCKNLLACRSPRLNYIIRTVDNLLLTVRVRLTFSELAEALRLKGVDLPEFGKVLLAIRLYTYDLSDGAEVPGRSGSSIISQAIEMDIESGSWRFGRPIDLPNPDVAPRTVNDRPGGMNRRDR